MKTGTGPDAIGHTPMVDVGGLATGRGCGVWLKLEDGAPSGSCTDRTAVSDLRGAVARGALTAGGRVVEHTGGSTGIALALVSAVLGVRFTVVFSGAFAERERLAMEDCGAEGPVRRREGGKITPSLAQAMTSRTLALPEEPGSHDADRFGSPDVCAGHRPMGRAVAADPGSFDLLPAAVGTGAAPLGMRDGRAEAGRLPDVGAFEPMPSPFPAPGRGGPHRVEGIGVGFDPPFPDHGLLGAIIAGDRTRASDRCRGPARETGMWTGAPPGST